MGIGVSCVKDKSPADDLSCISCSDTGRRRAVSRENFLLQNCKLLRAAGDGDLGAIREALEGGAWLETRRPLAADEQGEPSGQERCGFTPLMRAAKESREEAVRLLLDMKAELRATDENGMQALHLAVMSGNLQTIRLLLQAKASPEATDDFGRTAAAHVPVECLLKEDSRRVWQVLLASSSGVTAAYFDPVDSFSGRGAGGGRFGGAVRSPLGGDTNSLPSSPQFSQASSPLRQTAQQNGSARGNRDSPPRA